MIHFISTYHILLFLLILTNIIIHFNVISFLLWQRELHPAPKLYKQGTTPINQYRSDQGRREIKQDWEKPSAEPIQK